jgi:NitT/TauT family transport system substrate-binding protein
VIVVMLAGCHRPPPPGARVRLGYFPTLTHAAALIGLERGTFAEAIAPVPLEAKAFAAGPEAMEALLAGALDAAYVGPMPALSAYLRSEGRALLIVAGASSGGAAFVARRGAHLDETLHGKKLAAPQLGNTQDVALRLYLRRRGFVTQDRGGDVQVMPIASPDQLSLMKRGALDGAWVPEPWVTRLVYEAGAEIFVDDRAFWPGTPSALLVVSRALADARPDLVAKLVAAHVRTVAWARAHGDEAQALAARGIERRGMKPLPPRQLAEAWTRVELVSAPPVDALVLFADAARELGYLPSGDVRAAVTERFLP